MGVSPKLRRPLSRSVGSTFAIGRGELRRRDSLPAVKPAALIVFAALGVAACGSSGGHSEATAKRGYINQVDAICAQTNSDMRETNARLDELARSARKVSEFQDDLADGQYYARDELADIKKVPVPKGSETEMKQIVADRDRQLDLIDQLIAASKRNDSTAFKRLTDEVNSARQTVRGDADKFGFKICGQDPADTAR
jgi:hypothetical protein